MKTNFDYKEVPKGYLHCQNAQCPRAEECLRFLVTRYIDSKTEYFLIINPAYIAEQKECPFFKPDSLTRFALGMTHLFDNLPHAKATKIRGTIRGYFGRTCFYRVGRKERLIKPEEQDFIRQTFINEGITEPPEFDKYIEQYAWF